MKRLVTPLVILIFVASLSFAQGMMREKGEQKEGQMGMMGKGMMGMQGGMMAHMMGGMHPMMYSMMVHHLLMKANTLDLTDAQKKELGSIEEKFLYPLVRKEADFKISHMKLMGMLRDPNFDAVRVKAEVKISNDINLEMANLSIDALSEVRKAIGPENFKKVMGMMPMMGGMIKKEKKEEGPPGEHEEHHEED